MKPHHSFVLACILCIPSACGPGLGQGDDMGETTTPPPQSCSYDGDVYFDGEEFETPDGCVRYTCENGVLLAIEDHRRTAAGDLELPTQGDVDQQVCLSVVEGTLTISGSSADLTPLSQLTRVGVDLEIIASEAVNLGGLESLAEVGGSIVISDNENLTTLAFQVYMSVFGDATIQNNDALESLAGAEFIGQCAACSGIAVARTDVVSPAGGAAASGGAPADEGADEPFGGTFYGKILIADNDVLTDITALSNLYFAWDDVRFRNNAMLESLSTMLLSEVQGDLEISGHASMSTADAEAFASMVNVLGVTTVCGNLDGVACP